MSQDKIKLHGTPKFLRPENVGHLDRKIRHPAALSAHLAQYKGLPPSLGLEDRVKRGEMMSGEDWAQGDLDEIVRRLCEPLKLEKPQGSSTHHFLDFMALEAKRKSKKLEDMNAYQSIVVEHDWAQAFAGTDLDGEIRLPYDSCCFEFRVNGLRQLMFLEEGSDAGMLCTGVNKRWYVYKEKIGLGDAKKFSDEWQREADVSARVIAWLLLCVRCVCVMLDADVAEAVTNDVGVGLNKKRLSEGKSVLKPYHIVSLRKRNRYVGVSGSVHGSPRLHFRRGHWRHFEHDYSGAEKYVDGGITKSRTWVKWQLVGDPDLGFVDKHYRL